MWTREHTHKLVLSTFFTFIKKNTGKLHVLIFIFAFSLISSFGLLEKKNCIPTQGGM